MEEGVVWSSESLRCEAGLLAHLGGWGWGEHDAALSALPPGVARAPSGCGLAPNARCVVPAGYGREAVATRCTWRRRYGHVSTAVARRVTSSLSKGAQPPTHVTVLLRSHSLPLLVPGETEHPLSAVTVYLAEARRQMNTTIEVMM